MSEHVPDLTDHGEVTGPIQVTAPQLTPAPRVARIWRDRAVRVVRGDAPPTISLGTRTGGDEAVSQRQARAVIDLALRVGEAMLSTGASASDCVATVLRLVDAYGIRSAHVDITFTSISVSIHRGLHEDPLSVMRVVPGRSLDYTRLEGVQRLVDDVVESARGEHVLDVDAARRRLMNVLSAPHPYRRWVVTLGAACMGVGIVMLFGAGPVIWLLAALSATVVDRVQRLLYRAGVAAFFTQAISAAVPALIALLLLWGEQQGGLSLPGVTYPSLVVISGIVILLAGLGLLGATQDALDGYYVTAGARGLEVVLMTLGIAVGVAVVMAVANGLGVSMEVGDALARGSNPFTNGVGAVLVALGFCLTTYAGLRTILLSTLTAISAWLVFTSAGLLGLDGVGASALAAAPVGALAYAVHRRLRVPELAVATASIVPLLPGLAVYRAINLILLDNPAVVGIAVLAFVTALSTGLALAAGLSVGGYLARRRFGLDRAALRARRRSRGRQA
ncbi:threonine/serine ThrE exporter family protein [Ornithinimicrobium sp. Y1694]|uniref:threonine/serine ThrE exporter family protein n=1 Tax=Ornithinimicrobium sp. Y1694 TaxID=3418590 RepID=UPI003CEDA7CF